MRVFVTEADPISCGVVFGAILDTYPEIQVHHINAVNNVRLNSINQPYQTAVMYITYTLPDGREIDQKALNLQTGQLPPVEVRKRFNSKE